MNKNKFRKIVIIVLFIVLIIIGLYLKINVEENNNAIINEIVSYKITDIPQYNKDPYVFIDDNIPNFSDEDIKIVEDYYSSLEDGRVRNGNAKDQLGKG